jgi:phage-related minor tail protein
MTDGVARLGIEIDSSQVTAGTRSINDLAVAGGRAETAARANTRAIVALGQATATAAEQTRAAAIAQANVAAVLGAGVAAADAHGHSMHQLGQATGLTSMQMQEFTAIARHSFDALAVGANPLTVITSHAASLGQALGAGPGGVRASITALGATVLPFAAMAAGAAAVIGPLALVALAFEKGAQEAAKLNNALAVTNGYAGLTAGAFDDMAKRIAAASDTGIGKVRGGMLELVQSGKLTSDTIEQIVGYSAKLAELTGQDSGKIAQSFADMKDGIVQFAVKHAETYHDLTLAQIDYIAQLEKAGKHHEAELQFATDINTKIQGVTVQYGLMQNALHGVETAAGKMWDALLGIGRPKTIEQQIADATDKLATMKNLGAQGFGASSAGDITAQERLIAQLKFAKGSADQTAADTAKAKQAEDDAIRHKYDTHHGPETPSDTTGQRTAAVDAAIAQAKTAELQGQLSLTTDITARAKIEKDIAASALVQKQAQTARQIAEIEGDKGLSAATKAELEGRLRGVQATDAITAGLKARLIDEQAADALVKQALDVANAQRDAQTAVLGAQLGITTSIAGRYAIETKLLDLADQKAIADAQAVIDSQLASAAQKQIAQLQIDAINGAHGYKAEALERGRLIDTIRQQADQAQSALSNQIAVLGAQADAADFEFQRVPINRQILLLEQEIARNKAKEAVAIAEATGDAVAIAKARAQVATLEQVQPLELKAQQGSLLDAMTNASSGINSMASAFAGHDWVGGLKGFDQALTAVTKLMGGSGPAGSILSALSAVAPQIAAAAQLVELGGQIGGAITKAVGGDEKAAQKGSMFGAAGSILTGVFNVGGFSTKRDDAEKAATLKAMTAQADAAAAAFAKLQKQQGDYTSALGAFYTASGQGQKALQYQRDQEIDGLDEATAAIKRQTYAWDDYNDALKSANDNVSAAESALRTAYDSQVSGIQQTIGQFTAFSESLAAFRRDLASPVSLLMSPQQSLAASRSGLAGINARIGSGDTSALGDVQATVQAFVDASKANAPDRVTYLRNLAVAQRAVDQAKTLADSQIDVGRQQLAVLNAQVSGLIQINSSVLTVAQAIANLQTAKDAAGAVTATAPPSVTPAAAKPGGDYISTHGDYAAYVRGNADLMASWQSVANDKNWQAAMARLGLGTSIDDWGKLQWTQNGSGENRAVRPFAMGGAFTNGIVDGATPFSMGVMGEAGPEAIMPLRRGSDGRLGVASEGGNAALLAEIRGLRAEVAAMRTDSASTAKHSERTAKLLTQVTRDGRSLLTEAAA